MLLRLLAPCLCAAIAAGSSAVAQQVLVDRLSPRFAAAPVGSETWFGLGIELVEAKLLCDVAAAMAAAEQLWKVAEASPLPGARPAIGALAELVCARLEGETAAAIWRQRAGDLVGPVSQRLLACFHLSRARCLCLQGDHAEELMHSVPGQAAADQLGDALLRLRAAQMNLHLTPRRGLPFFRSVYDSALAGPDGEAAASFLPWLLLNEYVDLFEEGRLEEALQRLDQAERVARHDGNRRALVLAHQYRADYHKNEHEIELAIEWYAKATTILELLGDRTMHVANLDMRAYLMLKVGEIDAALPILAAAEAMVAGRGMLRLEREILHTRLDVAIRQRDGDRAAQISGELDAMAAADAATEKRLVQVRAELRKAESDRAAAEERLLEASQQALERARSQRAWAGAGITLALAVVALVTWRSRRKLLVANAALADQMRQVEVARAQQAQLEERMRAIERTESLGTMAAGVAHDFNNLLTGILGNAELLAAGKHEGDAKAMGERIAMAGQQAARLCRQLQIYAGGAPLQQVPLDLVAVLRALLPVLQSSAHGAIDVQLIHARESIGVLGDRAQLEQVLLNLVMNAHDAKARTVRIAVAGVGEGAEARTRIEVTDDGEGMPPEVAQRVFDPFFTTRFPGRGLGLAVVYGVARRHGGSVEVTSAPGRGTTFTLLLPAVAPPEPVAEPIVVLPAPSKPGVTASVLLVDDDATVRQMLQRMLRELGRPSTAFADGPALLAALAELPSGGSILLFVDLAMPEMDGSEVVRLARECRPEVRIVLMSGHDQAYVDQMAGVLGPDYVLAKPFRFDALRAAIDAALHVDRPQPRSV
ncbi:MAG: ATP-binding protein [Planctomycetes bacterium]|jgi:signal transduction histidine kinase/ActR/RegA family two-component response regulator|nr:ATP-binding protein [Planctomycetota bacterium]